MALIKRKDGATIGAAPLAEVGGVLAELGLDAGAVTVEATADEIRLAHRRAIAEAVGDVPTLVGTASDGMQFLLCEIARLTAGLAAATTLAQVRDAAGPLNQALADFKAGIDADTIRLPYTVKAGGEAAVLAEIAERATATAEAFEEEIGG